MATIGEQLTTGPLWRRLAFGLRAGTVLGALLGALVMITSLGGRYHHTRGGSEYDAWAMAVVWTIGCGLSLAVAGVCGPMWRDRWSAALATALSLIPLSALVSVAFDPHGPHPYQVDWEEAALMPFIFAVVTPIYYGEAVRRMREIAAKRKARERAP